MKKYFLSVFISLFLLFQIFTQPQLIFAAGETWTWQADGSLTVTGGQLSAPATIPKNSQGYLTIKQANGSVCSLSVLPQLAADDKSATIEGGFNLPGQNPPSPACPASIQNQYYGTKVQIGGTPPGGGTTGGIGCISQDAVKNAVAVVFYDTDLQNAPDTLTFNIGGTKQVAHKFRENDAFGNNYTYSVNFCPVNPGDYEVCAPPLLPCKGFTKKDGEELQLSFGNKFATDSVLVGVMLLTSDSAGPYPLQLKQGSNVVQAVQTTKSANQGTSCNLELQATFLKVKPGNYTVCIPKFNTCQDFSQTAGQTGNVTLDVAKIQTNGNNPCSTTPPIPPPPSPPCVTWIKGQCTLYDSAFGNISTNPGQFIQTIFAILLSISGGIALLLIIRAGYRFMVSRGKPDQVKEARDELIAAIIGLIFLIFSFVFLQLIGVDILHIPGFSGGNGTGGGAGGNNNVPICKSGTCIQLKLCTTKNPGRCNTNGCPAGQACVQ